MPQAAQGEVAVSIVFIQNEEECTEVASHGIL